MALSIVLPALTFFGNDLNRIVFNDIVFDTNAKNDWIWGPCSNRASTVDVVYDYLNSGGLNHFA